MNDDELREHLRTTLEPIHPDRPDLASLRRTARRRRRRLQLTAGTLGLLLIAGAGVGIAAATTGGSGRAVVSAGPGSTAAAADVTASCAAAELGSTVTAQVNLTVGQTLVLEACSSGAESLRVSGGAQLQETGDLRFRADSAGLAEVTITGPWPACQGVRAVAPPPPSCSPVVHRFDVTVTAGPAVEQSSAVSLPPPSGGVSAGASTAPCRGGRVSLLVGMRLTLTDCPPGIASAIANTTVLTLNPPPSSFLALNPGTSNVELYVKPVCSPGAMCPQFVRDLGTLVVTVTSR